MAWDVLGWDVMGLGRFGAWDVLRLGPFGAGTFYRWDLMWWDLLGLGRFWPGTFCLGTFCRSTVKPSGKNKTRFYWMRCRDCTDMVVCCMLWAWCIPKRLNI